MKIIRGTKDAKGTVLLKGVQGGVKRIRCPKCQMLAVPATKQDGASVLLCGGCGAEYRSRPL